MSTKNQLKTEVQIKPKRSQTVLVSWTILAGVCLATGFYFLWEDKNHAWVPLLSGFAIFGLIVFSWFKSQKDTDLEHASPTILQHCDGSLVQIDARALMAPDGIQLLEKIMSIFANRIPLPEPDGIIDSKGNPIPNSQDRAIEIVDKANDEARKLTDIAAKNFGINAEAATYTANFNPEVKLEFNKSETLKTIEVNRIEEAET